VHFAWQDPTSQALDLHHAHCVLQTQIQGLEATHSPDAVATSGIQAKILRTVWLAKREHIRKPLAVVLAINAPPVPCHLQPV